MKLVLYPAVESGRLEQIVAAAAGSEVVNAASRQQAQAHIEDANAFFGKIDADLLGRSASLRWIQAPTASLEHYVFPELVEHPAVLTNMRGIYSDVIADHVFGFVICFARNFHHYIRAQARGLWAPRGGEEARSTFAAGPGIVSRMDEACFHLAGATLGIVGFGGIGSEVARRGTAFGMRVVAVDPRPQSVPPPVAVWPAEQLPVLLAESDFVVIAAPHTPGTVKLFRRPQFRRMRPSAWLINVGRGAIVDLEDLCDALDAGELAGAGLDVFEVEPLPTGHRLWRMENVILTPHVAGVSPRIAQRHLNVLLDNIGRFLRNEPLRNLVNKAEWF